MSAMSAMSASCSEGLIREGRRASAARRRYICEVVEGLPRRVEDISATFFGTTFVYALWTICELSSLIQAS